MDFKDQLNELMTLLNVRSKELSELTGLSLVVISRYRSGARRPAPDSDNLTALAKGLAELADKISVDMTEDIILQKLTQSLSDKIVIDAADFAEKLASIKNALGITIKELAIGAGYDPSYFSRIVNGSRKPENLTKIVNTLSTFLSSKNMSEEKQRRLCGIIGAPEEIIGDTERFRESIFRYFSSYSAEKIPEPALVAAPLDNFLQKLDDFNLEDYISAIHFDGITLPAEDAELPLSRFYYGIKEMRASELDFVKATLCSSSKGCVTCYSDMPIAEMAKDADFTRKFMLGYAMMIKKGLRVNVIHDVSRPIGEMMLGLEAYIPLYMTGQISPYYLRYCDNRVFNHMIKVSGGAAIVSQTIADHHEDGRNYMTRRSDELVYYNRQAQHLLEKASPLMEIYTSARADDLTKLISTMFDVSGARKLVYSVLPSFTISDELLEKMLTNNRVDSESAERIRAFVRDSRTRVETFLEREPAEVVIPEITEENFAQAEPILYLPELFLDFGLRYTIADHSEHLRLTKEFLGRFEKCTLEINRHPSFRNINIVIVKGRQVFVSKATSPTIHFVINHPKMIRAFENYSVPVFI